MADEAHMSRVDIVGALRKAGWAGLIAFGLFLPLIGFNTVQNIRNELVLELRWPLLLVLVALVAGGRLSHALVIGPTLARYARQSPAPHAARLRAILQRFGVRAA